MKLTATQKIEKILKSCDDINYNVNANKQIRNSVADYKKEIIINRSVIGDKETLSWFEISMALNNMMYKTYGKSKDF